MFPTSQQLRTHPALPHMLSPLSEVTMTLMTLNVCQLWMEWTKPNRDTTGLGFSTRLMGLRSSTKQPVFSSVFASDEGPYYGQTCNLWRSSSIPCCLRLGAGLGVLHNGGMISSEPLVPNEPFFPQAAHVTIFLRPYDCASVSLLPSWHLGTELSQVCLCCKLFYSLRYLTGPYVTSSFGLNNNKSNILNSLSVIYSYEWLRREQPVTHGSVLK